MGIFSTENGNFSTVKEIFSVQVVNGNFFSTVKEVFVTVNGNF